MMKKALESRGSFLYNEYICEINEDEVCKH